MKLPMTTWTPGDAGRPDDSWLAEVAPELLVDVGVRLFERGQGFEAHEAWELAWKTAKREGDADLERMLRALICLAAAMVKVRQGVADGVLAHARGARALLEELAASGVDEVARFRVEPLLELARRVESAPPAAEPVGKPMFGKLSRTPAP